MGTASDDMKLFLGDLSGSTVICIDRRHELLNSADAGEKGGKVSEGSDWKSPVLWVAHGEPAEQRSEEYGTKVVALADREPPRIPDRWVGLVNFLLYGWRRFAGLGAGGGPDRGRMLVGPAEWFAGRRFVARLWTPARVRGNCWFCRDWRRCAGRLRDRSGWIWRSIGAVTGLGVGAFQGAGTHASRTQHLQCGLAGGCEPPCLGTRLVHKLIRHCEKHWRAVPDFRRERMRRIRLPTGLLLAALISRASEIQGTTNAHQPR